MKKTLILFFLALLAAPLWGQKASDYRAAAERGDKEAQYNLGVCYYTGEGVTQDYKQAVHWYTKAANQGVAEAQYNLGVCYYTGEGVAQDDKQAIYWFTKAANQGVAEAQYNLGVCYYTGDGAPQDKKQAVYWFTKAANQGNADAQYNLGICYDEGEGVAEDDKQAVYWYTKAANQGDAAAQYHLGQCYFQGAGVAKDCRQALNWLKKAEAQENELSALQYMSLWALLALAKECAETQAPSATPQSTSTTSSTGTTSSSTPQPKQVSAAELFAQADNYRYGRNGVAKNLQKAVELYTQAANMGDAEAQLSLGYCYYMGEGVGEDCRKAHEWLKKAEVKKHTLSATRRQLLETTLTNASACAQKQRSSTSTSGTTSTGSTAGTRYSSGSTSRSKYGRWPWYYDGIHRGIQLSYIQRAIYGREASGGRTGHYDMFGNEGWAKGIQFGLHFNPRKDKEILGMNTGFYLEFLFDRWKDAPSDYYDSYFEMNLHVPLEAVLYLPFSRESALHLRAGVGADFSCFGQMIAWDDSYVPNHDVSYGSDFINRFNLSLNLGASFHYEGWMFHVTYQKGLLRHPFASGYRCTLDKLSLGVSFVIDD